MQTPGRKVVEQWLQQQLMDCAAAMAENRARAHHYSLAFYLTNIPVIIATACLSLLPSYSSFIIAGVQASLTALNLEAQGRHAVQVADVYERAHTFLQNQYTTNFVAKMDVYQNDDHQIIQIQTEDGFETYFLWLQQKMEGFLAALNK